MMAKNYIDAYQTELAKERASRQAVVPTVKVLVADAPLRYGEILRPDAVRAVRWPANAVPEGSFTSVETLFPADDTRQRFVLRAMEKDEAIMAVKVTEPGEDAGLISRLERGMRAFAIRVDVASGVSGFLRPGDRVDIYWTGRIPGNDDRGDVTKLIESGITLIAIDQTAGGDLDGALIARTVTVAVRPDQVAKLAQAQSSGGLSLALLGAEDDTVSASIEVDQRSLLGLAELEVEAEPERERVCTIRTRRGAEVVEIAIPCTN
jgi:pilus assembly protein CpaB